MAAKEFVYGLEAAGGVLISAPLVSLITPEDLPGDLSATGPGVVRQATTGADLSVFQASSTGETSGFTAGSGTPVLDDSTFTGGIGSTAYNLNDIVKALKQSKLLAD